MAFTRFFIILWITLFSFTTTTAQPRFKGGLGINYISNTYPEPHLADYFAFSGNLSYTFLRGKVMSASVENATSIRWKNASDEMNYDAKSGFTTSFPLIANLHLPKITLYAGTGPAYVRQSAETNQYYEKASGFFLNTLAGVGFTGKRLIEGILRPEYNIRLSYLKDLRNPAYDGGMISFIVFLKT